MFNVIMEELSGQLPGSSVFTLNDGFFYHRYQSLNDTQYFRCIEWRLPCSSRISLSWDGIVQTGDHSHEPNISGAVGFRIRSALLDQERNRGFAAIEDNFNNIVTADPMEQHLLHHLHQSMTRARLQRLENLVELRQILENPEFSRLTALNPFEQTGYRGAVQAPNGSQVLLFLSRTGEYFLQTVTSLFIVKTSLCVNNQHHQLLTIATTWGRNEIPLAFLLLESNSPDSFLASFTLLRTHLMRTCFTHVICCTSEVSHAFHQVYPMVKIQPSFFDYINDIKANVQVALLQSPAGIKIVKLCCAMLLLPKDLVQIGLHHIVNEAQTVSENLYSQLMPLFNFIEQNWLNSADYEFTLCGNFERTHYSSEYLRIKFFRDLTMSANTFSSVTRYIISTMLHGQKKICKILSGLNLRSTQPVPIGIEPALWNLLEAPAFTPEIQVYNILKYVSDKINDF